MNSYSICDQTDDAHVSHDINKAVLQHLVAEHSQNEWESVSQTRLDEDWYTSRLMSIGLLTKDADGAPKPTNAAVLLCADAENGREISAGHWVEISTPERPPTAIDGSLTHSIRQPSFERFEEANQSNPSEREPNLRFVQPYGPIALKELLANALIHRDYETAGTGENLDRQRISSK